MPLVTVYGRSECVQCRFTEKQLAENNVEFRKIDIDQDPAARRRVEDSGKTQLPMVVAIQGDNEDVWHGFRPDKIKSLAA